MGRARGLEKDAWNRVMQAHLKAAEKARVVHDGMYDDAESTALGPKLEKAVEAFHDYNDEVHDLEERAKAATKTAARSGRDYQALQDENLALEQHCDDLERRVI